MSAEFSLTAVAVGRALLNEDIEGLAVRLPDGLLRIPIESDHLFRSNPIADSGVSDHLAGAGVS
jgi:hypothetical protein